MVNHVLVYKPGVESKSLMEFYMNSSNTIPLRNSAWQYQRPERHKRRCFSAFKVKLKAKL